VGRLGEAGAPLHPRIESEMANHLGYLDSSLAGKQFLVGNELTGADIEMSFVAEVAGVMGKRARTRTWTRGPSGCTSGPHTRRRSRKAARTLTRTER